MDDASIITALDTPALAFSPSSIILFGDRNYKSTRNDHYGLLEKYEYASSELLYPTIFRNYLVNGKHRVLRM